MANVNDTMKATSQGLTDLSNKVKSLDAEWGQVGASSSAALGVMSAALSKTNPILAQGIGSLQKMVPILQQIATAAKTSGTALKTAFASSGIGLLVVAITEAVTLMVKLRDKAHEAARQAQKDGDDLFAEMKRQNDEYEESKKTAAEKYLAQVEAANDEIHRLEAEQAKFTEQAFADAGGYANNARVEYDRLQREIDSKKSELARSNKTYQDKVAADAKESADAAAEAAKLAAERAAAAAELRWSTALSSIKDDISEALAMIDNSIGAEVGRAFGTIMNKVSTPDTVVKTQDELAKQNRILYLQNQLKDLNLSYARGEISKDAYDLQYQKISAELQALNAPGVGNLAKSSTGSSSSSTNETDGLSDAMEGLKQYSDIAFQVSDAISNLGSAYEENIRRQVDAGKLSSKEGKRRLKEEAAIQGSLALTAGLAASIYSMYSVWKDNKTDLWVKVAMSVATAASIVGQTISTVNSIKAAGSGLSGSTSAAASVTPSAVSQTYIANPNSNQDVVDAVNNTTQAVQTTQTVLVVDDYKKVADQANRVQVQSSF